MNPITEKREAQWSELDKLEGVVGTVKLGLPATQAQAMEEWLIGVAATSEDKWVLHREKLK